MHEQHAESEPIQAPIATKSKQSWNAVLPNFVTYERKYPLSHDAGSGAIPAGANTL
jgi:hypothetical protein